MFKDDIPPCRTIIGDQAAGLVAAIPMVLPKANLQICDWHAVEAMKRRFRTSEYKKDKVDELSDLCWSHIESPTSYDLEKDRHCLIDELRQAKKTYVLETWQPKKQRVVYCYTHLNMNLGCTSSSRSESYHPVLRMMTNGQLSLDQSA